MAEKLVQEQFGEAVLTAIRQFARQDLGDPAQYENRHFSHVADAALRTALAETMYGGRWIYKLGLALLVQDAEQLAHVRAQIFDYASVCEGLLGEMIRHAIAKNIMSGRKYLYKDTRQLTGKIVWRRDALLATFQKLTFFWCIEVAKEEHIITDNIAARLHTLRRDRNSVHLRSRTYRAYLDRSKSAFEILTDTIGQTRDWRNLHP